MRMMRDSLCLLFAMGLIILTPLFSTASTEAVKRTVRGTVTATNTTVDPQTIVVKVMLPNKKELVVGARVPAGVKIMRGTKTTKLADLKAGEATEMTYLKSPDGLIAQSIHVH